MRCWLGVSFLERSADVRLILVINRVIVNLVGDLLPSRPQRGL